jgi:hypothetical protein
MQRTDWLDVFALPLVFPEERFGDQAFAKLEDIVVADQYARAPLGMTPVGSMLP